MEKHQSRSSAKRVPPVNDDSFDLSSLVIDTGVPPPGAAASELTSGLSQPDKQERRQDKPSREDISRCINIWASVYLGRNAQTTPPDAGDLRLPARPWMGRNPNSLKRFE